jgi:hypothetical protein
VRFLVAGREEEVRVSRTNIRARHDDKDKGGALSGGIGAEDRDLHGGRWGEKSSTACT